MNQIDLNDRVAVITVGAQGMIALTKSLAKEVATRGVLVNAITPAVAKTSMFEQMTRSHIDYMLGKIPMGRFIEVGEIAAMAAWLSSEECSFSTGAVFDITGGQSTY
jgi:3-oxoacyl-[acyl-carrier protein] reductase